MFLNVSLIALPVNKAVLILAKLEKLHVLLVAFTLKLIFLRNNVPNSNFADFYAI